MGLKELLGEHLHLSFQGQRGVADFSFLDRASHLFLQQPFSTGFSGRSRPSQFFCGERLRVEHGTSVLRFTGLERFWGSWLTVGQAEGFTVGWRSFHPAKRPHRQRWWAMANPIFTRTGCSATHPISRLFPIAFSDDWISVLVRPFSAHCARSCQCFTKTVNPVLRKSL